MNISEKYISEVLSKYPLLHVDVIKKDLMLSYILQDLCDLDNLVFKGGTCLSKCYLKYHRLSEDLDFNLELQGFESKTRFKREVRNYFKNVFLLKLQKIADDYNFDFDYKEFSEDGRRYCPVKSGDDIFVFHIYSNKNEKNPIKIEINISEKRIYDTLVKDIINLDDQSKYLTYPLRKSSLKCYSLDEIILEKIRAILTRQEGIHERDIFDLFLINKKRRVFDVNPKDVVLKLKKSFLYKKEFVLNRLVELKKYKLFNEIDNLSIINFSHDEYKKFFLKLVEFIEDILK